MGFKGGHFCVILFRKLNGKWLTVRNNFFGFGFFSGSVKELTAELTQMASFLLASVSKSYVFIDTAFLTLKFTCYFMTGLRLLH